ncbi:3-mercaptopyruvate sulfurtransferase [Blastochloris viridis]|uniref:Sulfurtransferase n=1 Tax=Blastochloris viridis TaxID=1079 RepID=A0A0H5BF11_BLAVI|nr:3-mercaptopyruvate sulfurtransferase [Blastochloris viridis]ALK09316.1 3-mercaptopyruvate sulfurtransferase [Blastochloris viridis]BAS00808.1 thiosulfate sulfurtransferase [Blastochloris viridis]CUU41979.1 3-mercaptopyruvate sulfurtransferase [Blastochloris viridis]
MPSRSRWLVSTEWLAAHLGAPDIVVVDGTYHLPATGRDAEAEYLAGHIPHAVRFDIDSIKDPSSPLPHMVPPPDVFGAAVGKLGIGNGQTIVVYDAYGLFSAARVWWTFRIMGAREVFVLDGGLPKWRAEDRPIETGPVTRPPHTFNASLDHSAVAAAQDVLAALTSGSAQVADARGRARFYGELPEARPDLRAGHMPGARNVPFDTLVADGRLTDEDTVRAVFTKAGIDLDRPIITSCGSGVTAAVLTLALDSIGKTARLYDGSWAEWGYRTDLPVTTEAA